MAAGKIRSVVATAALELGIDWGDVDLVIQVAAPKGVSRLLQRVEALKPQAGCAEPGLSRAREPLRSAGMSRRAHRYRSRRGWTARSPGPGSLDVVVQHILSCACSGARSSR